MEKRNPQVRKYNTYIVDHHVIPTHTNSWRKEHEILGAVLAFFLAKAKLKISDFDIPYAMAAAKLRR